MVKAVIFVFAVILPLPATAHPFGDAIPKAFQGLYSRSDTSCRDPKELAFLKITEDALHYYEADEYLVMGISFEGSSSKNSGLVPMLKGRFLAREEISIVGDIDLELVMATPTKLIRYGLQKDGEIDEKHADVWIPCPAGTEPQG
jgi:hypothetical protein